LRLFKTMMSAIPMTVKQANMTMRSLGIKRNIAGTIVERIAQPARRLYTSSRATASELLLVFLSGV
jgi:hypothetical protein